MENRGLLIIKSSVNLGPVERGEIKKHLKPLVKELGLAMVIVSDPMDATVHYDPAPMIEALKEATKALNAAADRLAVRTERDTSQIKVTTLPVIPQPKPDRYR